MIALLLALAALQAEAPGAAALPAPEPRLYVTRFCGPITLGEPDPAALRQHYADWSAKVAADEAAQAFRPQDADAPGQMVSFAAPGAPRAFVDRRRGACSLVYPGAKAPLSLLDEMATAKVNFGGPGGAPVAWRPIVVKRVGPPGPIRYFLPASEDGRFGLCATVFEDLRLHDESSATLVRVQTCRPGGDEINDNG